MRQSENNASPVIIIITITIIIIFEGKNHASENITVLCLNCLQRRVVLEYTGVFSERQMLRSFTKIFIHSQKWPGFNGYAHFLI